VVLAMALKETRLQNVPGITSSLSATKVNELTLVPV